MQNVDTEFWNQVTFMDFVIEGMYDYLYICKANINSEHNNV
jgi:hypothetical protein